MEEIRIEVKEFEMVGNELYNIYNVYNETTNELIKTYKRKSSTDSKLNTANKIAENYTEQGYEIYDIKL